jgi:hypothetical protein
MILNINYERNIIMCMTKKDFKAIAAILADARECFPDSSLYAIEQITTDLDEYFENQYPRYNGYKFLEKAGFFKGDSVE